MKFHEDENIDEMLTEAFLKIVQMMGDMGVNFWKGGVMTVAIDQGNEEATAILELPQLIPSTMKERRDKIEELEQQIQLALREKPFDSQGFLKLIKMRDALRMYY